MICWICWIYAFWTALPFDSSFQLFKFDRWRSRDLDSWMPRWLLLYSAGQALPGC